MLSKEKSLSLSFCERFAYWVKKTPDHVALLSDGNQYTYAELNRLAMRLAKHLACLDGQGAPVALYLPRSPDYVIASLGVIHAGQTYMPLDVDAPMQRLQLLLSAAKTQIIVTSAEYMAALEPLATSFTYIIVEDVIAHHPDENKGVGLPTDPDDNPIACVLFTSGTTGVPKGVNIKKSNIINLTQDTNYITITTEDVIAHVCDVTFDISVFDIWGALLSGATLAVSQKNALIDSEYFTYFLKKSRATILFLAAAIFHRLASLYPESLSTINTLLIGGEKANAKIIRDFFTYVEAQGRPSPCLINTYGPTENTTNSTYYLLKSSADVHETIPIGSPIRGVHVFLLNEAKQRVPANDVGEIYVAGKNLSAGYLGELDDERFQQIEVQGQSYRAYRTGDLAYQNNERVLYYVGRVDHQFKRQGKRIEPGEIESVLMQHADVQQAIVIAEKVPAVVIYAYVVLHAKGTSTNDRVLRAYLQACLPAHMVPQLITVLPAFPLTPRGKVDRAQLPRPKQEALLDKDLTETEALLANLWCHYLPLSSVSREDNFFEVGGDSIIAIQIAGRAREAGLIFNPAVVFRAPTLGAWARECQPMVQNDERDSDL